MLLQEKQCQSFDRFVVLTLAILQFLPTVVMGSSYVIPVHSNSTIAHTGDTMLSYVGEQLEQKLDRPRHLIFGDIDMVVGFEVIAEVLRSSLPYWYQLMDGSASVYPKWKV